MKKTIAVIALIAAPALASAQAGLSRIEFLALQQELRDQGCGVTNVDGRYGPQTRRAIATCAKKFNSANNARAVLVAMNIGFGPGDNPPATGTTGE
jgi:peptidoglycan hydrolase-like protein with peptidoglycan-binding domain